MKKIFFILSFFVSVIANAQFTKATLQASGLTCAMCSKAIDNSLQELSFVASVKPNIKTSTFTIIFKEGTKADLDVIKKAVEDAGFFVAKLKVTSNFNNISIKNDEHISIDGKQYHFLNVTDQVLNGEKELTIVDKNFITGSLFKKYSKATAMECIKTGKAGACCKKIGLTSGTRIYHVTI